MNSINIKLEFLDDLLTYLTHNKDIPQKSKELIVREFISPKIRGCHDELSKERDLVISDCKGAKFFESEIENIAHKKTLDFNSKRF